MIKIKRPKSKQPIPSFAKKVFKGIMFDVYQWQQKMFEGKLETFEKMKLKPVTFEQFLKIAAQENFRDIEIALKIFRIII